MSAFDVGDLLDDPVGALRDETPDTPAEPVADTVEETTAPQPDEGEDTATSEPEKPVDPDVARFLQKYDGDIEKALRGAAEQQSLVGRLGQELGELRSKVDEIPRQPAVVPPNLEDLITEQPRDVAMWALQQGNQGPVYDAAMREWYDQSPMEAARFEQDLRMEMLRSEFEARQQPFQQTLKQQAEQQAVGEFARQNPDVHLFADMIQEIAAQNPVLSKLLGSDDPAEKVGALGVLYQLAKGSSVSEAPAKPDTLTDEARATALAHAAAQADQDKAAAAVITGGNTNTGDQPPKALADQIWDAWGEHDISRLRDS